LLHSAKGRFLSGLHEVLAFVALGANALAAAWGGVSWLRKVPSTLFWPLLRVAQATVAIEVLIGVVLWLAGKRPPDQLHYVYGLAPLFVAFITEGMRIGAAQRELEELEGDLESLEHRDQVLLARRIVMREIGVMTVGTLLVVTLLGRAAGALI
jgi:hypothetical protein